MTQNNRKSIIRIILSKKNVVKQKYYKKEICPQLNFGKISKNTKVKASLWIVAIRAGNHNDAYELEENFSKMLHSIQKANIPTEGLFLNTDSGFDTKDFRSYCYVKEIFDNIDRNKRNGNSTQSNTVFDELLYKTRFVIERTNAWLDAFKAILIRFEANDLHRKGLLLPAFSVILLRRL